MHTTTTLVTGATGKTGSRVAQRLADAGHSVRLGSRSATPRFDWEDATTWPEALSGVEQVYIAYQPDVAIPGSAELMARFAEAAKDAGATRLVFLSGRGEPEAQRCEQVLLASGLELTIVRASWFAQNFTEGYLRDGLDAGVIALPAPDTPEPFIDIDDIAEIAARALTTDDHVGATYDVTGPRLLTFAQAVDELSERLGRPVRFVPISADAFAQEMAAHQVPPEVTDLLLFLFGEVLDGRNAHTTSDVERALGRPPRDFFATVTRDLVEA